MTDVGKKELKEKPERESGNGAAMSELVDGEEKNVDQHVSSEQQELETKCETTSKEIEVNEVDAEARSDDRVSDCSGDDDPVSELELLRIEKDDLKDRFLRALADSENIRKIAEREKREASKYATTGFARDMLSVHDNLLRALDAVGTEQRESSKALIDGLELTLRELLNALSRHGIAAFHPKEGDIFDPNLHQAMYYAPVQDKPGGTIITVFAKGFTIHERLLRAAQVGVSAVGKSEKTAAETDSGTVK